MISIKFLLFRQKNHKQTFLTSKLEAEIYIKTSTSFQRCETNTGRSFFLKKSRNFQFQPLLGIITCRYNLEAPKRIALVVWESQSPSRKDWKHGKLQILFFLNAVSHVYHHLRGWAVDFILFFYLFCSCPAFLFSHGFWHRVLNGMICNNMGKGTTMPVIKVNVVKVEGCYKCPFPFLPQQSRKCMKI